MNKPLRISLKIFAILVLVLIGTAIALPFIIDPNDYKDELIALVHKQTGRELAIPGDIELSVFPWLGVELGAVTLGNAKDFGPEPMAQIQEMDVRVQVWPLLKKQFRIGHVTLKGLNLDLARNQKGITNWDDLLKKPTIPEADDTKPAESLPKGAPLGALAVEGLTVSDARISWTDAASGQHYTLHDLNMNIGEVVPDQPVPVEADMKFTSTEPSATGQSTLRMVLTINSDVTRISMQDLDVTEQLEADFLPAGKLDSHLQSKQLTLDRTAETLIVNDLQLRIQDVALTGNIDAKGILTSPAYQAELAVKPFSLRKAMIAFGISPPITNDPSAFNDAALSLQLAGTDTRVDISNLKFNLDDSTLRGKLAVTDFKKPALNYTLELDKIDADRYLPPPEKKNTAQTQGKFVPTAGKASTAPPQNPKSNLHSLDVDGRLNIGQLKIMQLRSNNIVIPVQAKNGHIRVAPLSANLSDDRSSLQLHIKNAALSGNIDAKGGLTKPAYQATVSSKPFSPRKAMAAFGIKPPTTSDPKALTRAEVSLQLSGTDKKADVSNLKFRVDDTTVNGKLAVSNFQKPAIRYTLAVDRIDADRYLPPAEKKTTARTEARFIPTASTTTAATTKTELPLETLRALDVNGRLTIGKLKIMSLNSSNVVVPVKAQKGQFRLAPLSANLYQGKYKGNIQLDVTGKTPRLAVDESVSNVQIGPLLKDFQGDDKITGTANLSAKLTARGLDPVSFRKTLNGTGRFSFNDGVVKGFNIAQMERQLNALLKGRPAPTSKAPQQTDFSSITGSFNVTNGLVTNKDLRASLPHARVIGNGKAYLVSEELDYTLSVKFTSEVEGQTGTRYEQMDKTALPIRFRGSFSDPSIEPDFEAVIKDLAQRELKKKEKELKERVDKELEKKADELFKGLFKR